MRHLRFFHSTLCLLLVLEAGCGSAKPSPRGVSSQPKNPPVSRSPVAETKPVPQESDEAAELVDDLGPLEQDAGVDFSFSSSGNSTSGVHHEHPGLATKAAVELVQRLVRESVDYGPTLVVWLIDKSPSGRSWSENLRTSLGASQSGFVVLDELTPEDNSNMPLLNAVCTFGKAVEFPLDPPSQDPEDLVRSLDSIDLDSSGREMAFTAVESCLERYLPYRTRQRRELLFVMITDEAGDDQNIVSQLAPTMRQTGVALYVIGVPAPFGRSAGADPAVEAGPSDQRTDNWQPVRQGPESVHAERIQLGFGNGDAQLELIDSGFGPYALEYLCRASGGRFLALRPPASGSGPATDLSWPATAVYNFAPDVMRRYAPDYVPPDEYRQLLEDNSARKALFQAARLTGLEVIDFSRLEFRKQSEAELARQLSLAQQSAARLEPAVNALYETLTKGESDRDKLTRPRWQAGYDLALGRATAAKARIDGYNTMLAALKRGRNFENESSDTWVLEPSETIEVSSALRRLVERSAALLARVVDEHPGTPWAALARRELSMPAGWKWTER